jgi:hypothetical protein
MEKTIVARLKPGIAKMLALRVVTDLSPGNYRLMAIVADVADPLGKQIVSDLIVVS